MISPSNLKLLITGILLTVSSMSLNSQEVNWMDGSWDLILEKARISDRPIFIDVYTSWCGPCRQMDKNVFTNATVGNLLNLSMIPVKIDAEDDDMGTYLANKYGISAYPGLLFLDAEGMVITSVTGYYGASAFLKVSRQVLDLYSQNDFINRVKNNMDIEMSVIEFENFLSKTEIHSFPGKERLVMCFLDLKNELSEDDLRLVMGEIENVDLGYLERIFRLTNLSYDEISLRRNKKDWMNWKVASEQSIVKRLNGYIEQKDFDNFESLLMIFQEIEGVKSRQVDNFYLDYYRQNDLKKYKTFAEYLLVEHVLPMLPGEVHTADEEKYSILLKETTRIARETDTVEIPASSQEEITQLDSLRRIYTISRNIAEQLYEISSDFFVFFDDSVGQGKARQWAALAYQYYPYHRKFFDNHLFMLESSGKHTDAQSVRRKLEELPWYKEMSQQKSF